MRYGVFIASDTEVTAGMYQALYRKWRPMTFSDVVGQRHITDTLKKQIETNRLSHAYLFTGTRGTGKTTCAKILAKAANCLDPKGGEPCNECFSCVGINNGSIIDISEIDAASYTGVDNIRQIRDEAAYVPSTVRMRVYIIDECHMLTTGANNALLKILEEPPPHVLFILATTEPHKIPATILSRCQIFTFRRLRPEDIAMRLLEIAASEKIPLDGSAAELIAKLADGALRDAISMLDQCAASADGPIDTAQVLSILGLAGNVETMRLVSALAKRDTGAALEILDQIYSGGKDISAFLGEISSLLRDLLVFRTTGSISLLTGNYDKEEIKKLDIGRSRLIVMLQTVQDTLARMQRSQNRRVDAELCLISMCDETLSGGIEGLAARIERLEKGRFAPVFDGGPRASEINTDINKQSPDAGGKLRGDGLPQSKNLSPRGSEITEKRYPDSTSETGTEETARKQVKPADTSEEKPADIPGDMPMENYWPGILEAVRSKVSVQQFSFLSMIKVPVLQGSRMRIITESSVAYNLLNRRELLEVVDREASAVLGRAIKSDVVPIERFESEKMQASGSDKLDKLIERGRRLGNLTLEQ